MVMGRGCHHQMIDLDPDVRDAWGEPAPEILTGR
jgi:hypothetical protein